MALTKRQVDALRWNPEGPQQQVLYDGELSGFGVRVYQTGAKAVVIWYTARGRRRLFTIGAVGVLTVQQARERARRALVEVSDGADPLEAREGSRQRVTLREFSQTYLERHAKPHKKSWSEDQRRLASHVLPKLGARPLSAIARADVLALHAAIGAKHPHKANRVLALISVVFAKAIEWGALPEGAVNPASRVKQFRERSRDRWVTPAELPALLSAIDVEENPYHRAAFRLYLMTGLRRSELLTLRWDDVDLERGTVHLRETKAGRPHTLPLSTPAIALLSELPRLVDNGHVFPAVNGGGHAVDLKKPWRRVRDRAGLSDVRLHDLRRTVGSMLALSGASLPLIGRVLNHTQPRTTQIYARFLDDAARSPLEALGQQILAQPKVIDLQSERRRRAERGR